MIYVLCLIWMKYVITSYYLDIPVEKHIKIIYLIALVSLPFIWNRKKLLIINLKQIKLTSTEKSLIKEFKL